MAAISPPLHRGMLVSGSPSTSAVEAVRASYRDIEAVKKIFFNLTLEALKFPEGAACSPALLVPMMGMLLGGLSDEDKPRVMKAMGIPPTMTEEEFHAAVGALTREIAPFCPIANFIACGSSMGEASKMLEAQYGAKVTDTSGMSNENIREMLNAYIEENTKGTIRNFFPLGSALDQVAVGSAFNFDFQWLNVIGDEDVSWGTFKPESGEPFPAKQMMTRDVKVSEELFTIGEDGKEIYVGVALKKFVNKDSPQGIYFAAVKAFACDEDEDPTLKEVLQALTEDGKWNSKKIWNMLDEAQPYPEGMIMPKYQMRHEEPFLPLLEKLGFPLDVTLPNLSPGLEVPLSRFESIVSIRGEIDQTGAKVAGAAAINLGRSGGIPTGPFNLMEGRHLVFCVLEGDGYHREPTILYAMKVVDGTFLVTEKEAE